MSNDLQKGQHFMVDEDLLKRIVESVELESSDIVLEIGSGEGALTKHLLKKDLKKLICIELDEGLKNPCNDTDSKIAVELIIGNALEEIKDLEFNVLVANIPYHISEPLFKELFFKQPDKMVLVVGKAFSELLKKKTIIGLLFNLIYEIDFLEEISPKAFNPKPRTKSSLIRLLKKQVSDGLISKRPEEVLKQFFRYPRSKVKNFLEQATKNSLTKRFVREAISAWLHGSPVIEKSYREDLLEKPLYSLSTKEFLTMKEFIYFHLFGKDD